jgi:polysaccharide export outer membrane protein
MQWCQQSRPFLVLLVALTTLAGHAPLAAQESAVYRIGVKDKVEVRVKEMPALDQEFEVRSDGTIFLPVVGTVAAQGRSEVELAQDLRVRLEAEGLRRATVEVRVTGFFSRPISVLGEVDKPGVQHVPGRVTLLEALLAAGFTGGHDQTIQVRRRATNGLADTVVITASDLFELGDPTVNIPIFAGDVIFVPPVQVRQVNILGAVESPGTVLFKGLEPATLLIGIGRVGGLAEEASNKIRIRRREGEQQIELVVNYRRILDGKDPDVELQDGDMIIVKESFF